MAKKDATQKGVSGEEEVKEEIKETETIDEVKEEKEEAVKLEEKKQGQLSAREEAINAIHDNLIKKYEEESGITHEEPDKNEPKTEEKTMAEKAVEDEVEEEKLEETVKLKIDGKEQDVPISKILDTGKRALQKQLAADTRLEEATKILKEAKDLIEKNNQRLPPKKDTEDIDSAQIKDAETSLDMKELVKAIQYGEEDEAAKALEKIVNLRQSQAAPKVDVKSEVKQALLEEEVEKFINKPEKDGGFKELWEVPMIQRELISRVAEALKKGEPNNLGLYTKIAGEVKIDLKKLVGPTEEKEEPESKKLDTEKRIEKKRKIETISPASAILKTDKEPEKEPDASEIIAEIRKARGQS